MSSAEPRDSLITRKPSSYLLLVCKVLNHELKGTSTITVYLINQYILSSNYLEKKIITSFPKLVQSALPEVKAYILIHFITNSAQTVQRKYIYS